MKGIVFGRCGTGDKWGRAAEAALDSLLEKARTNRMFCAIYIPELAVIEPGDMGKENELRRVVRKYRSHPAVAFWKGADEPEWGKIPVEMLRRFYEIIHELDPDHPVVDLVATHTRLTRAQVHDEQLARRASTPPTP